MITVRLYTQKDKIQWDDFIDYSKNGTFILKRNYMEYHSNRFHDYSLMFFEDNALIALLPACIYDNEIRSHDGLTYGGIVSDYKMTIQKMLSVFDVLIKFCLKNNIKKIIYKRIPSIYYRYPSDEDLYALFKNNAILLNRNISSAIEINNRISYSPLRKRCIKKALNSSIRIEQSYDFDNYIKMLNEILLARHNTKAVHSAEELSYLANLFPNNIKMYCGFNASNVMLAGVVIYENNQTVHAQYMANSKLGCKVGALDLVIDYLINDYSKRCNIFDFGISMEHDGSINNGLVSQKEGFGGRTIVYDIYEIDIKKSN